MGTQEATYCGIPILGIPIFADQDLNLLSIEKSGRGRRILYDNITKENILDLANDLLENSKYVFQKYFN